MRSIKTNLLSNWTTQCRREPYKPTYVIVVIVYIFLSIVEDLIIEPYTQHFFY